MSRIVSNEAFLKLREKQERGWKGKASPLFPHFLGEERYGLIMVCKRIRLIYRKQIIYYHIYHTLQCTWYHESRGEENSNDIIVTVLKKSLFSYCPGPLGPKLVLTENKFVFCIILTICAHNQGLVSPGAGALWNLVAISTRPFQTWLCYWC